MMLAFLALLGAPYIYDISSLRVKFIIFLGMTKSGVWVGNENM